ncbi:thioredoxin-dependent thiol peroxidase [Arthrobacter sp. MYb23]|nr:thioredoxin-dependent thiol peroxidase [Arthrobacter sp. MYb51]PRB98416.1 thioredoxin-dependent thiol peroxidase [Arthrobacter sp. MYb23]
MGQVGVDLVGFRLRQPGQAADNNPKFLAQPCGIHGNGRQNILFKLYCFSKSFNTGVSKGHHVTSAVRITALPGDMPVQLKPCESGTHRLGLDPRNFGQSRLGDGALGSQHLHGNDTGVGKTDGLQFFVPRDFHQARGCRKQTGGGPSLHIWHAASICVEEVRARLLPLNWKTANTGKENILAERLIPGDVAPDFTLQDETGKSVSLSDLRERKTILYFYPAASTPGCTKEACDFRDTLGSLQAAGYDVVGVSPDPVKALAKFTEEEHLTFRLLSDEDHAVAEAYGAWGEKKNYGRSYMGLIRSTIVVDPDGKVSLAQYNVRATGHVAKLRRDLKLDK